MTHARTLPRYVGIAGLVAGLLAPVSSLAQTAPAAATVTSISAAGSSGSDLLAKVVANTKPTSVGSRIYWTQSVPVARATLRRGALAALGRGFMHPGLAVAITAAGFLLESDSILAPGYNTDTSIDPDDYDQYTPPEGYCWSHAADQPCSMNPATACHLVWTDWVDQSMSLTTNGVSWYCRGRVLQGDGTYINQSVRLAFYPIPGDGPTELSDLWEPASPEQLEQLDPHIPPELLNEMWASEDTVPEWENEISIMGKPATDVEADGNPAPEVAKAVGKRAANIAAQVNGEETPYPESGTEGHTAEDEMLDQWKDPPPPGAYPSMPEPSWNVEVIDDLPDYDAGLGGGGCPAPNAIEIPLYGTITLDWQPACDLASNIRGAVIGICFIAALYIVLGQSRSSES